MPKDQFAEYQDAPADSSKEPITEEGSPEGQGDSIHIPTEFLQGKQFKAGDELVLKVVSADEDGVEVEYAVEPADDAGEGAEVEPSANDEIDQMSPMMEA
jgi:hypothetical protein